MSANIISNCTQLVITFSTATQLAVKSDLHIKDCAGTVLYESLNQDYTATPLTLTPAGLGFTSSIFPLQPLRLELTNYLAESKQQKVYLCIFPLCDRLCDLVDKIDVELNNKEIMLVAALEYAEKCSVCSCDSICNIFNELTTTPSSDECIKCKTCEL